MVKVVGHLPCKHKALCLNPSAAKENVKSYLKKQFYNTQT
jgi:hypothetical protein